MTTISLRAARRLSSAFLMAAFAALSFGASLSFAADAPALAGKWKMASITPDGSTIDWTLTLKREGDSWTATVSGVGPETVAKDVKVEGASLHMKTPYNEDYYDEDLKLDGDKLTGKWSGNGDSGATTGTRTVDAGAK
jgi:hypothetical protein